MTESFADAPLVGRTLEIKTIANALTAAEGGAGKTMFVTGEGGIGKTRVATAGAERAAKRGWNVMMGRAYPVETGVPYAVFSDAMLPLFRSLEPSTLSVLSRGGTAELQSMFPALGNPGGSERSSGADPAEFKARMLWNFTQFLNSYSKKQPVCIVLENLQWADASSLELFHFVARQIGQHRVMLLGTYNDAERDSNPILRATEQSLVGIGAASVLKLTPLTQQEVSEVVQKGFGVEPESIRHFTALLYAWTRGNPFFVGEILKSLVDSGQLRKSGDRWIGWDVESLGLPGTIRDVVGSRIQRLSESAREITTLCAVLGTRTSYELLSGLSKLPDEKLVETIDELRAQRVLDEVAGTAAEYDFSHPLLQQVIYGQLGAARAKLLHASIAESLEKLYGSTALSHADELAFHYSRAHGGNVAPKAIRYLSVAGRAALSRYSNREAASYLGAALEQSERNPDVTIAPPDRAEILISLARARQRIGEYKSALELWTRARDEALHAGDHSTLALAEHRIGLGCYWSAEYDEAWKHYEAALAAARKQNDKSLTLRIHLARASCLQDLGNPEARVEIQRALDVAEESKDAGLLARAHRALLVSYAWTGPTGVAREHGEKAIRFSEQSGQRMLEWTAHWGMALLSGVTADPQGVARHMINADKIAEELGSPVLPIWTAEFAIQYATTTGDWDSGLLHGERAIALARSLGQKTLLPRLLVWTGLIYVGRGDFEKARAYMEEAWKLSGAERHSERPIDIPSVVPVHHGMAVLNLEQRNYEEAIRFGEAGLAIADRAGYTAWTLQWVLPVIGEAALWSRDFERALSYSQRMRRDATRMNHRIGLAWADACDALLIFLRDGNPGGAVELLRSATDKLEAIPFPASAARIRRLLARALRDSGNREEAAKELRHAHDVLKNLGAAPELDWVREEFRELGARPPAKSVSAGAAGLTGRELEIARMVAGRKSNKEIATELKISARTVSTHLSNIFTKLGVDSRGALADFVRDNELLDGETA